MNLKTTADEVTFGSVAIGERTCTALDCEKPRELAQVDENIREFVKKAASLPFFPGGFIRNPGRLEQVARPLCGAH